MQRVVHVQDKLLPMPPCVVMIGLHRVEYCYRLQITRVPRPALDVCRLGKHSNRTWYCIRNYRSYYSMSYCHDWQGQTLAARRGRRAGKYLSILCLTSLLVITSCRIYWDVHEVPIRRRNDGSSDARILLSGVRFCSQYILLWLLLLEVDAHSYIVVL